MMRVWGNESSDLFVFVWQAQRMDDLERKRHERLFKSRSWKVDAWQKLVESFGIGKPGTSPWNANLLDDQYDGANRARAVVVALRILLASEELRVVCDPNEHKFSLSDAGKDLRFADQA
jgi:hypothetical protein